MIEEIKEAMGEYAPVILRNLLRAHLLEKDMCSLCQEDEAATEIQNAVSQVPHGSRVSVFVADDEFLPLCVEQVADMYEGAILRQRGNLIHLVGYTTVSFISPAIMLRKRLAVCGFSTDYLVMVAA